jgi:dGTPase
MKSVFEIAAEINRIQNSHLSPYATKDQAAFRKFPEKSENFRPPFALDRDRIIYSGAFRRYTGKTQVVYFASMLDEQLSSRSIHTLSVAQIARTIGRLLGLNIDLIEAIALGHDLGHPPFGHDGEVYLSRVSERHKIGKFFHNIQSLRVVDVISKRGAGLNLTLQVREGLLSHDGEIHDQLLAPQGNKDEEDLTSYIRSREGGEEPLFYPMTLEGCVVRICDTIAYIGQDIEDAIRLNLITRDELPLPCTEVLGNNNGAIIETLVRDAVENSYGCNYISFSKQISEALKQLKQFNYRKIYKSARLKVNHERIARGFDLMFEQFLHDIEENNRKSPVFQHFLNGKVEKYIEETIPALQVRDYMAGMTDRYFTKILKEMIIPEVTV